jgi:ribose-phosphate pyrophosphokinase
MTTIIFNLDSDPSLFGTLASRLDAEIGQLEQRKFPDGESYLRSHSDCQGKDVVIFCNLYAPDNKLLKLLFLSNIAQEMQANRIGLVTPYLPYMRQDKQFHPGECVTSKPFAKLLSASFDFLVTMDPHLHRYHSLDEIYSLKSAVVPAAPLMAKWIKKNINTPLLIGPDSESAQWVSEVAQMANAPFQVLEKIRYGDRDVEVSIPALAAYKNATPVLVDDIISSGRTMLETIHHLQNAGMGRPVCMGVHGIFAGDAYQQLCQVADVITTQCISHPSNVIEIGDSLADATLQLLNA